MRYVEQSVEIRSREFQRDYVLEQIEDAARDCYQSAARKCSGSAERLVKHLISSGHEAMLEHGPLLSMRFITDRGISHEIVRHRLFSFAQESTRYVKYGKNGEDIKFILPEYLTDKRALLKHSWSLEDVESAEWSALGFEEQLITLSFIQAESTYRTGIELGLKPQQIRDVLSTDVKTSIVVSGNIREWRHFFNLRTAKDAHPRMQLLATEALRKAYERCDVVFEDIYSKS